MPRVNIHQNERLVSKVNKLLEALRHQEEGTGLGFYMNSYEQTTLASIKKQMGKGILMTENQAHFIHELYKRCSKGGGFKISGLKATTKAVAGLRGLKKETGLG